MWLQIKMQKIIGDDNGENYYDYTGIGDDWSCESKIQK